MSKINERKVELEVLLDNEVKTTDIASEKQAKTCDLRQTLPGKDLENLAEICRNPKNESKSASGAGLDTKNVQLRPEDICTPLESPPEYTEEDNANLYIFLKKPIDREQKSENVASTGDQENQNSTQTENVPSMDEDTKKVGIHTPDSFESLENPEGQALNKKQAQADFDIILDNKTECEQNPGILASPGKSENSNSDKMSRDSFEAVRDTKNSEQNNIRSSMSSPMKWSDKEDTTNTEDSIESNTSKVGLEAKKGTKNEKLDLEKTDLEIPCSKLPSLMKRADNQDIPITENATQSKLETLALQDENFIILQNTDYTVTEVENPGSEPTSIMRRSTHETFPDEEINSYSKLAEALQAKNSIELQNEELIHNLYDKALASQINSNNFETQNSDFKDPEIIIQSTVPPPEMERSDCEDNHNCRINQDTAAKFWKKLLRSKSAKDFQAQESKRNQNFLRAMEVKIVQPEPKIEKIVEYFKHLKKIWRKFNDHQNPLEKEGPISQKIKKVRFFLGQKDTINNENFWIQIHNCIKDLTDIQNFLTPDKNATYWQSVSNQRQETLDLRYLCYYVTI
jgi:hypothetical protein